MRLHGMNVTGLRKDFNKIIVRQEVETGEGSSLSAKIVFKTLLDLLQSLVVVLKLLLDDTSVGLVDDLRIFVALAHVILPELVNVLERLGLSLELGLDVLSVEDVLEVHPLALESEPLIDHITEVTELALPFFDLSTDLIDESGSHHSTDGHDIVFEVTDDFFDFFDDEAILGVTVLRNCELTNGPVVLNLLHLATQICFSLGHARDFLDEFEMVHGFIVDHPVKC